MVASSPSPEPKPDKPRDQLESSKLKSLQLELGSEVGIKYLNSSPRLMSVLAVLVSSYM